MNPGAIGIVKAHRGYPHHATFYRVRWAYVDDSGQARVSSEHLVTVPDGKTTRGEKARFAKYLCAMLAAKMRELGVDVPQPILRNSVPLLDAVAEFCDGCALEYSARTCAQYVRAVRDFAEHCQADPTIPVVATGDLQQMHVSRWREARLGYGLALNTVIGASRGVQAFCAWLLEREYSRNVVTVLTESIRKAQYDPEKRAARYRARKLA